MVAEDDGEVVSGTAGQGRGDHSFSRLQPYVLPAIHPRVSGDAAALSRVSGRVPGAERAVDGRRVSVGGRVPAADGVPGVVFEIRKERGAESMEVDRAGMDDAIASAG